MVTKAKNKIYQEFAARLHKACDDADLPKGHGRATALGKLIGITYKGAGKWLNGDGMPDMGNGGILAVKLEVAFEWLMTGRGPMKLSNTMLYAAEPPVAYGRTRNKLEIIAAHMPPGVLAITLKYVEMLQEMMEEQPELFACSKSEREFYKKWKRDYQKIKKEESAQFKS